MSEIDAIRERVRSDRSITDFQRRVYLELLNVPRGMTITYGELARRIGCRSAQAVGQALKRNPFAPDVPCHRVISSDGTIGGFYGKRDGEMIDKKYRMLAEEGVLMRFFVVALLFIGCLKALANDSVDTQHRIEIDGDIVKYEGEVIRLGERCFFVDGSITDAEAAMSPWIFNDFNEAMGCLTDGTEADPMRVFVAPWVYWIDDPDDDTVRVGVDGREPIGLTVRCENLHIIGLNPDPRNVVLAAARGQTQGAVGNFTMIEFWGDGLEVKNLTMGNFCNVDLEYPLRPQLGRSKRMSAITQAHVAYAHGDRIYAENVRFISRLNMNPLSGGRRTLFNRCHLEMTDDALAGSGVYLSCSLDYYGAKPFWSTHANGAVLIDCDLNMCNNNSEVFFCKGVGQVSAINCRINSLHPLYFGWTKYPPLWLRCYEYNVSVDGKPYSIGGVNQINTVDLSGLPLLNAYIVEKDGSIVYNTYNLLCGDDGWDPLGVKKLCEGYDEIATSLIVTPRETEIITGGDDTMLTAEAFRHCGYHIDGEVQWSIIADNADDAEVARLTPNGNTCRVAATNLGDETKTVVVQATLQTGLQGSAVITVRPSVMPVPEFIATPTIDICDGEACVSYTLNSGSDCSEITWKRVVGTDTIDVAVSRDATPKTKYRLSRADLGHTLIVEVRPKSSRSELGDKYVVKCCLDDDFDLPSSAYSVDTDFSDFPTTVQPKIIDGAWTVDCYKPADTAPYEWTPEADKSAWVYSTGFNGAKGQGLLQCQRGARLLYTPEAAEYADMELWLDVDPTKTAGQGFGSATGQYMDVCVKFDTRTLTGYALRIERTTKYSNAVDFSLVRYADGVVTPLTEPISSVCYRTGCHISLKVIGDKFTVKVYTDTPVSSTNPDLTTSVELESKIQPNAFGGIGIQHTGTCGESTTMLHRLKAIIVPRK